MKRPWHHRLLEGLHKPKPSTLTKSAKQFTKLIGFIRKHRGWLRHKIWREK